MRRQKRKKKCLTFACKRLLQTDMRRHRCRRGPGEGSRQVQPPAHPASCSIPSLGGGRTHTPSIPGRDTTSKGPYPGTHILLSPHAAVGQGDFCHHPPRSGPRIPARGTPTAGGDWGGLAPTTHSRAQRSPCRRITPERERGCPAPPQIFFPTQVEATQETRSRQKLTPRLAGMQTPGTNAARTAGSAGAARGQRRAPGTWLGDNIPVGSWDRETLCPRGIALPRAGQQPAIKNQPQEGRGSSAGCSEMDEFQAQIKQTTRGAKKLR